MRRLFVVFFNDTATTEIYTLSLHDALPISIEAAHDFALAKEHGEALLDVAREPHVVVHLEELDRKSTRLNSSHANISYAVFCLQKKSPAGVSSRPFPRSTPATGTPPVQPCL